MLFSEDFYPKIKEYTVIFSFFAKKIRTQIIDAHFGQQVKNIKKC